MILLKRLIEKGASWFYVQYHDDYFSRFNFVVVALCFGIATGWHYPSAQGFAITFVAVGIIYAKWQWFKSFYCLAWLAGMVLITQDYYRYNQSCLRQPRYNTTLGLEVDKVADFIEAPHRSYIVATIKTPSFLKYISIYWKFNPTKFCLLQPLKVGDRLEVSGSIWPLFKVFSPNKKTLKPRGAPVKAFDTLRWYLQGVHGFGKILRLKSHIIINPGLIESWRQKIQNVFQQKMSSITASIASALVIGDRYHIPKSVRDDFNNAGLAHLLAISGLHLGIVAGWCFIVLRKGLCLVVPLGWHLGLKSAAAILSCIFCLFYMAIAGFGLPVQRAMIMVFCSMIAIIINRKALGVRSLCVAALVILALQPNALFSPSFQLSFAAVLGLVGVFQRSCRDTDPTTSLPPAPRAGDVGFRAIMFCHQVWRSIWRLSEATFIATIATIPFTLLYFNRFTLHSFWTNLVAIPITSYWVMPMGLLACLSIPFGGLDVLFYGFGKGIDVLVELSHQASSIPFGQYIINHPTILSLGLFLMGSFWLCLWQQPWRYIGLVGIFIGLATMLNP